MGRPDHARFTSALPTGGHPLVVQFRAVARAREYSVTEIADRSGVSQVSICHWSTVQNPTLPNFDAVLGAIGCRLAIVDEKTGDVIHIQGNPNDRA